MDIKSASEPSANMAAIRSKNTKPEIIGRKALTAAGCRYRLNRSDIPGKPDIAMIGRRIAIFVHGCFWHAHAGCPRASVPSAHHAFWVEKLARNKARDAAVRDKLLESGWRVLRVWECALRTKAERDTVGRKIRAWIESARRFARILLECGQEKLFSKRNHTMVMHKDIYTEAPSNADTLANLGPLARLAGTWYGDQGVDTHPQADGPETEPYIERIVMEPIDAQNNGPQVLYGLRYHVHIVKPGELAGFHDQVGYWLWEPATGRITHTLAIPRAQVAMATGVAKPGDKTITVKAERGSLTNGIISGPFLEEAFKTVEWTMSITFNDDGTWSYDQVTKLIVPGVEGEFLHTDHNTLRMIEYPRPNPRGIDEGIFLRR